MPSLNIPPREQNLLNLYSKDFILMFEYDGLLDSVSFEKESLGFNLALSRLSLRFADMVRTNPLFPRLKGLYSKTLVENAWLWSKVEEKLKSLASSGIPFILADNALLRLHALDGIPRKMLFADIVVRHGNVHKAKKLLDTDNVRLRNRLFEVRTLSYEPDIDPADVSLELQFLMLCCNNIYKFDGNVFNIGCLQWVMDAVDIIRRNPGLDLNLIASLAESYGQTAILEYSVDALKTMAPSIFADFQIPYRQLSSNEDRTLELQEKYVLSDRICRENAGKGFFKRLFLRIRSNWYDLARYYPYVKYPGIILMTPGYYYRKYFLGSV